ncbi:Molybdenum cofactor guanylyltransferase [Frondihabitans sp. 762G35]|uniref:molybdenum cofactor guanylyltransferase n=1 Tax=Frondihabitans sp. 762G35 TaxID=1446794 RepID=UPI000D20528D|nr:NTP transferase domain-containing protein [Frondihabitans sp. 762G35]ARC58409.1 Molybdenum cofactor guanylyltransferase [Frondihabitans sp. 762G35]
MAHDTVVHDAVSDVVVTHDAVLLAGGRATRLGGIDKTALRVGGETLLDRAVRAATAARRLVIVGLDDDAAAPPAALRAREEPRWSGPASAVAAGLRALDAPAAWTLVLACDVPRSPEAVSLLLAAATAAVDGGEARDGLVAVDDEGHRQPLLALYRSAPLRASLAEHAAAGTLENLSMRRMLAPLDLVDTPLPTDLTADVDTPDDAARLGASGPPLID